MPSYLLFSSVGLFILINQLYSYFRLKKIVLKLRSGEYRSANPFFISLIFPAILYTAMALLLGNLIWICGIILLLIQMLLTYHLLIDKISRGGEREMDSSQNEDEKAEYLALTQSAKKMRELLHSHIFVYFTLFAIFSIAVVLFGRDMRMVASAVNLRGGAGTSHAVITTLEKGVWVEYLGEDGNWKHVRFEDSEGYIYKTYLMDYSLASGEEAK